MATKEFDRWNDIAEIYSSLYRDHWSCREDRVLEQDLNRLLRYGFPRGIPITVLDVGCGAGLIGKLLWRHKQVERYIGVDLSPTMLMQARQALFGAPFTVTFLQREWTDEREVADHWYGEGINLITAAFSGEYIHGIPSLIRLAASLRALDVQRRTKRAVALYAVSATSSSLGAAFQGRYGNTLDRALLKDGSRLPNGEVFFRPEDVWRMAAACRPSPDFVWMEPLGWFSGTPIERAVCRSAPATALVWTCDRLLCRLFPQRAYYQRVNALWS